jgi:hypothetical protein
MRANQSTKAQRAAKSQGEYHLFSLFWKGKISGKPYDELHLVVARDSREAMSFIKTNKLSPLLARSNSAKGWLVERLALLRNVQKPRASLSIRNQDRMIDTIKSQIPADIDKEVWIKSVPRKLADLIRAYDFLLSTPGLKLKRPSKDGKTMRYAMIVERLKQTLETLPIPTGEMMDEEQAESALRQIDELSETDIGRLLNNYLSAKSRDLGTWAEWLQQGIVYRIIHRLCFLRRQHFTEESRDLAPRMDF